MRRLQSLILLLLAVAPFALGQTAIPRLNEKCTVSVLNRNSLVRPDGSWLLPNIPANFGLVRARASCVENGRTFSGESAPFALPPNASVNVPPIALGASTPIPSIMTVTATRQTLSTIGMTSQLTVIGVYEGNISRNITASEDGTAYASSNPLIATVTPEGQVQAVSSGTAIIQATNEGASGLIAISVVLSADSDGDGIPDDVEIREGLDPNDPNDALEDADRDALSNRDEITRGTLPNDPDSDDDTILDGEEAVAGADTFVTNPLAPDTDGDGVRDALEIETGSDPTNRNSVNLASAMTSMDVEPPAFTLLVNALIGEAFTQLRVTGHLRDGTTIDLTSATRGTNYNSSNLLVCNFGEPDGRVYGASDGQCTITVSNSGFTGTSSGIVRTFTPRALASIGIPGYANNVEVNGSYAYVAAGSAGLQVVNVSDPASLSIAGSRDTSGTAIDVRISGRYAYVADGASGLQIIDIINPAAPVIVGTIDTPGTAQDVAVAQNLVYVADGSNGLVIINAANPAAPIVVGSVSTGFQTRGVDVSGNFAVVADDAAIRIVNVSNAAAPVVVGSISIPGGPKDVRVTGTLAHVAAYTGGYRIIDFTNPAAPIQIGSLPTQFVPRDVEVAGRFAIFAEQLFPNAVPFVDILTPATPGLKGVINFSPLGDYAGTGIAVAGPYVYMTGESFVVGTDFGTTGNTRLFTGQYLPLEDLAGVPPDVTITSPVAGETYLEDTQLTFSADATDDVAVTQVQFFVNGAVAFVDTSAPYSYSFTVPAGGSLALRVVASDLGNNNGTAELTVPVIPDPLTTVSGVVVDTAGAPVVGANVTTLNELATLTGPGGAFSIFNVPTVRGDVSASVRHQTADGKILTGSSPAQAPVRGGVTNVGTIVAAESVFEENIGTFVSSCDDCFFSRTLPFSFPYYGTNRTQVFVGTNGYVTFTNGDSTYVETLPDFNRLPRIAAFFDDLYGRTTGGLYINDTLPGRFVVTYKTVQHFSFGGSNTLQIILFSDGRIQFAYRGMTALTHGAIVGITPGPNSPFLQVDYSGTPQAEAPAGSSIYEYFNANNPFDLDFGYINYTPTPDGGYTVRVSTAAPPAPSLDLTGGPQGQQARDVATTSVQATAQNVFAKAEVEVTSSRNVKFKGHTNTDHTGAFKLKKVPPGGINVVLTRNGEIVGVGSAVYDPKPGDPKTFRIDIVAPEWESKAPSQPQE
ncbi:MAG TPA: Ig-like domain-containing protein [Thermoanaerobaculia bacterium]|nr:Ig-like domain-containing protein [Thermoanaerobaculia bacterium]